MQRDRNSSSLKFFSISSIVDHGESGKVVSGTDWGNLLIWRNELVELEFTKRDGSNCHDGPINQLVVGEGELISIGMQY